MSDTTPGGFPYRQQPHRFCGSNSDRQSGGDPGHCEDCCSVGHVTAHPDLGCGDVGCGVAHGPEEEAEAQPPHPGPITRRNPSSTIPGPQRARGATNPATRV